MKRYRVVHFDRQAARAATLAILAATVASGAAVAGDGRSLEERCEAEVVELHEWIERWSNAELPNTPEAFARFGNVIAPGFVIIGPDGELLEREPIVEALRGAHGRWREAPGEIRIEGFRLHQHGGGLALATYEEWQALPSGTVVRLSSVLFGADDRAPNGLVWLHLHEVWLPGYAPAD